MYELYRTGVYKGSPDYRPRLRQTQSSQRDAIPLKSQEPYDA